ncbi:MAG: DUF2974 domain-containing protein [Spirochaetaceae bacterium]|jgi:hypothetical protein|nr:DUF2974 domain-containing protein [Spirochaetaceae bacterium]
MAGLLEYLDWRGDLLFTQAAFNPVDNIIFSVLAYYPFDGLCGTLGDEGDMLLYDAVDALLYQAQKNPQKFNMYYFFKDDQTNLLVAIKNSERYKQTRIAAYVNHIDTNAELQFSAVTFLPEKGRDAYIAFRGTDSSLVGWKEDFNMIFTNVIPAQEEALRYMETVTRRFKGAFYLGGHSKGGNLAVYAGAFCQTTLKKRIIRIYNNDGPGFTQKVAASTEYRDIKNRIISYIPQDSIIGLLFEHREFYVVKSGESGFLQHNPFLWQVRRGELYELDTITPQSRFVNKTLMAWLESMDYEHRQKFIGALFELLMSTNATSIPDLGADWLKNARLMIASLTQFDKETKTMLAKTFATLFDIAKNNFITGIEKKYLKKKKPFSE